MLQKKLLTSLVFVSFLPVFVGALTIASPAHAQVNEILESKELGTVALNSYNENALSPTREIEDYIVIIINTVLGLLGIIFLIIIVYAGFLWMTAGGNDEQVGKAKGLIINSIIGVVIIIAAYAISYFILSALVNKTPTTLKENDKKSFIGNRG